jgi:hypothetical protein
LLALAGALTACSGDSPTGSSGFFGRYALVSADGHPLPHQIGVASSGDALFLESGAIRVLSRGRVSVEQRRVWHLISGGQAPEEDTLVLTYRVNGAQVLIDYATYSDTGQLADNTLTVRALVNLGQGNIFHRELLYYRD